MGIELELHSERPAFHNWRAARATLIRGSDSHGEALACVLARLVRNGPGRLGRVDPYGNTLLNEQEAEAALLEHCVSGSEAAALRDLAALLQSCASTPGSHLWFIGD